MIRLGLDQHSAVSYSVYGPKVRLPAAISPRILSPSFLERCNSLVVGQNMEDLNWSRIKEALLRRYFGFSPLGEVLRYLYKFRVMSFTYDHRLRKTGHPVRSAIHKPQIGRLVVGWVTTSEYLLLYVFFCSLFAMSLALTLLFCPP